MEKVVNKELGTYSVKHKISMAKLEAAQRHCHPRLDISRKEDKRAVLNYHLKVAIQELQHQVKIRF
jgi:hypothetical protein